MAESPSYDARWNMATLMGVVDGTTGADSLARPGQRVLLVDSLSQRWTEVLNGVRAWRNETWTGEKITSACYRHHATESTWLLTLSFNGLGTPMELRPGMVLRYPLITELERLGAVTSGARPGVAGTTVRI